MEGINWLGALVGAILAFVVGGVWYGPLFGKAWQTAMGLSDEQVRGGNMPVIFGLSFLAALVAAIALSAFFGPRPGLELAIGASLAVGIGWVATSIGTNYLFGRQSLKLFFIDSGYHTVKFLVMGLVLALWP